MVAEDSKMHQLKILFVRDIEKLKSIGYTSIANFALT